VGTTQQRRGYAAEAAAALLAWAFEAFGLHRILAICDCRNVRSVALLERLGLRCEGHFPPNVWFKGAWADEYLYVGLREEWLAAEATLRRQ
jgi:RimJ/RimL family protein N-acetyltransferase